MTDRAIGAEREGRAPAADWRRMRPILLLPPALALAYPFLLKGFNASVFVFLSGADEFAAWSTAAVTLLGAFGIPIFALLTAMSLASIDMPTAAQRKATHIAVLAVAAAPSFVFLEVVLYMLHSPVPDTWFWVVAWAVACIVVAIADNRSPIKLTAKVAPGWLRVMHGICAACIVVVFLSRT
jgi:hypothetical protein